MDHPRALVLMYHQIVTDSALPGWVPNDLADPGYGLSISDFREQMALLRERNIPVVGLEDWLAASVGGQEPFSVIVTFDDGYASDRELAAPVLDEFGHPATFFLATGHLGRPGMLTVEQARELSRSSLFSIGSHGVTHRFLSHLSQNECKGELEKSLETLAFLSGKSHFSLSAPGGRTNARVADIAKFLCFRAVCTSLPGVYVHGKDCFSIPRLPVKNGMNIDEFRNLLDPESLSFRMNRWIRMSKNLVRTALELPRTVTGSSLR